MLQVRIDTVQQSTDSVCSAGDTFRAWGADVNPRNSGYAFSSDRGELREDVRPSFAPPRGPPGGHPKRFLLQPPGGPPIPKVGPDNGVPCIARSETPPPRGQGAPIPAGTVLVRQNGSTQLFFSNTRDVGIIPAGFQSFQNPSLNSSDAAAADASAGEVPGDGVSQQDASPAHPTASTSEGEGEGEGGLWNGYSGGAIIGATAAAFAVVLLAGLALLLFKRRTAANHTANGLPEPKTDIPTDTEAQRNYNQTAAQLYHSGRTSTGHFLDLSGPDAIVVTGGPHEGSAYSPSKPLSEQPPPRHKYAENSPLSERAPAGQGGSRCSNVYSTHATRSAYMHAGDAHDNRGAGPSERGLQPMNSGVTTLEAESVQNSATSAAPNDATLMVCALAYYLSPVYVLHQYWRGVKGTMHVAQFQEHQVQRHNSGVLWQRVVTV